MNKARILILAFCFALATHAHAAASPRLRPSAADGDFAVALPVVYSPGRQPSQAPVLHEISNPTGRPDYNVTWTAVTGADRYVLEEANEPGFLDPIVRCSEGKRFSS